ncbi:unnamed protein product [Fraxinus pennsylvanica]|uniref:Uncharacterized protein n=1 Tax=Fraxinus pennsylvanica TaxID=56036 RepID=A0AAD2A7Y2_9LAMI|nr:unnamed protein product [Fraxinus pennsylvanica]
MEGANKEEDEKMCATAANVAVRAATGVGDMLSRWQLMIEAKQKQGGPDVASDSQSGKDVAQKPLPSSATRIRENQEAEKRGHSVASSTPKLSFLMHDLEVDPSSSLRGHIEVLKPSNFAEYECNAKAWKSERERGNVKMAFYSTHTITIELMFLANHQR